MNSSHALIRRDTDVQVLAVIQENSRAESGRWALVFSPSRTLNQVYTTLGNVLEKQANRAAHKLGLGPQVLTQKIKSYFGSGEDRVRQLELLHASAPPKLEKRCLKLLKYTFPYACPHLSYPDFSYISHSLESARTQCRAFRDIVELITLFPGLRAIFIRTQFFDGATSAEEISALWDRHDAGTNNEWEFWNDFAATCLSLSNIAMMLQEHSIRELTICDEQGLSVIERLLIEQDCCGDLPCLRALCVRYLGGILNLPGFWLNIDAVHAQVANKLCREMVLVLKDIGVDILVLGPINDSESPFDYDGVDFLATTLLAGISTWFAKLDPEDWSAQPWYESFTAFLLLLRKPRAAELLPHSSAYAAGDFKYIRPSVYQDVELNIRVADGENDSPYPDASHNDLLANLPYANNSTISVYSRVSEQDDEQNLDLSAEGDGDSRSEGSEVESLEVSRTEGGTPFTSDEESCDCIAPSADADLHTQELPRNSGIDLIAEGERMLTADEESVQQEIRATDNSTAVTFLADEELIERDHSAPDELRNQLDDSMTNSEPSNSPEAAPVLDSALEMKGSGDKAPANRPDLFEEQDHTFEPVAKDGSAPIELPKRLDDPVTNIAFEHHGVLEGDPGGMTQSDDAGLHVHDMRGNTDASDLLKRDSFGDDPPRPMLTDSPRPPSFESPVRQHDRKPSQQQPAYANRLFNVSTTSLSPPSNPEHRDLIRTATSMLCKEVVKPPVHMSRTEAGLKDWEEVEMRVRALARLERIWKSNVGGSLSNLTLGAPASVSVDGERERRLFTEALRDGFVLCQLMNKLRSGSIVRPDIRDDGFVRTSNITKFLAACSSYGLPSEDLFQRDDLIEATSESLARVARTIIALIKYVDAPIFDRSKFVSQPPSNQRVNNPTSPSGPYGQGSSRTAAAQKIYNRETKLSESFIDLSRVEEMDEAGTASRGLGRPWEQQQQQQSPPPEVQRVDSNKPAIQIRKGKWPDDFIDPLPPPKSPTTDIRSSSPSSAVSGPRKLAIVSTIKRNESVESLPQFPRRPSHRARHSLDAPILLPKQDSLMRRDSSLDSIPSGSRVIPAWQPRGRFQSDVEGSSRRRPRPSSYDELKSKPSRSRFESMMNLGVASDNTSSSDLLTRDSFDGSFVRQTLIMREEGKPPTHFQLGNYIGRGQFGSVYRALNLNTGQMVAVKRIRLEGLKEDEVTTFMREVDLVKSLSHPSIVKYEGMARDQDTLSIVLEYAENGSLRQTLKAFGKLNERLVASYVVEILEGLQYLHSSDVVHCDLKAANILTTKNGNVKLSDFGLSLSLRAMQREIKDVAGTPNWMAPEVIKLKGTTIKSDIWSLGCTVVELLTGRPPYAEIANSMSVMFRIVEDEMPRLPEDCSPLLEDFLRLCFNKDPTKRPSADLLCQHQWLERNSSAHQ